jgi:threonine dehydrogenase-like Zn-dependent dehydrogenase
MRALSLSAIGQFQWVDMPEPPKPGPGEALVATRRVGICGSDLHAYRGRQMFLEYPRVLGHELAVEVLDVGPGVQNVDLGSVCAVEPFLNCGECITCRQGRTNCCTNLKVLGIHIDGGMCERFVVPAAKLHTTEAADFDLLAVVEPLCIGWHAVVRSGARSGEPALVIGAGPIGLAVAAALGVAGARILMQEVSPRRLEICREKLGFTELVDGRANAEEQLRALLDGDLPQLVFDCTGSPASMRSAFDLVGHGGRLVFVGHHPGEISFPNPLFHGRETTLLASRNATRNDFRNVIKAMERDEIDPRPWVAPLTPPEAVADEFPRWLDPEQGVIKPLVSWSDWG